MNAPAEAFMHVIVKIRQRMIKEPLLVQECPLSLWFIEFSNLELPGL